MNHEIERRIVLRRQAPVREADLEFLLTANAYECRCGWVGSIREGGKHCAETQFEAPR
jgi:hypothetical protein